MKLKKITSLGLAAVVGASAVSASAAEVIYNGDWLPYELEIVNDRAMADFTLLERIGISTQENDGVWSFKKGEKTLTYNERTESFADESGEIETDVAPVFTSNSKLMPLRATAENLGVKVGWDYGDVVLSDFDAYMEQLKTENPKIYKLLTMRLREPQKGAGKVDMAMDISIPEMNFKLLLKLTGTSEAAGGVSASGMNLEKLEISSDEFNLALADVTLDGLYDVNTSTIYLKTNAIEKIKDAVPAYADVLESLSQMMPGDTWYKISMEDYISFICEMTGEPAEQTKEMFDKIFSAVYGEGIAYEEMLRGMVEADTNSVYSYEMIEYMVEALQGMIDSEILKIEENEDSVNVSMAMNNQSLMEMSKAAAEKYWLEAPDEELTEEEIAELRAEIDAQAEEEFADMPFDFDVFIRLKTEDGVASNVEMTIKFAMEGASFNVDIHSDFDTEAEVGTPSIPENAQNLLPIIKSLMTLAGAQGDSADL